MDQRAREAREALVVDARLVLLLRRQQTLQFGFCFLRGLELLQVLGQAILRRHEAGLAQRGQAFASIGERQRVDDGGGSLLRRLGRFGAQRAGARLPAGDGGLGQQRVAGLVEAGEFGVHLASRRHGLLHVPGVVGQREFDPLVERRGQRLVRAGAAELRHQRGVVGAQPGIGRHARQPAAPQLGDGVGGVFQQFVAGRQAQVGQRLQRRTAQQRGEPAVEGADLHRAAMSQHGLI